MVKNAIERKNLLGMPKDDKISFFDVILIFFIAILLANVFVQTVWLSPVEVSGTSMEKTLQHEDWLLIDKLKTPKRGDVVVFRATQTDNYIKRIIAVEGDELFSKDGVIYLKTNGSEEYSPLVEDYAYFDPRYGDGTYLNDVKDKYGDLPHIVVEKGTIFVLGDNRWGSKDSRHIGLVDVSTILGVVPNWAIENRKAYAWYYEFVEKVNLWINKTFNKSNG